MSYVVKAVCYLDSSGKGVPTSESAQKFEELEMAQLTALTAGGFVIKIEDGRTSKKTEALLPKRKNPKTKSNQLWIAKQQNPKT